jgi:hypothetical protein
MSRRPKPEANGKAPRSIALELDEFAWSVLAEEANEMNVSIEELAAFALLYYVADRDSGRIARRMPAQASSGKAVAGHKLRVR